LPQTIAGMTVEQLREDYRHRLFDRYLPFWDQGGYDEQLGGFMCTLNDDGTVADDEKFIWYQGRGLWVYSYLYNNLGQDPHHLEIAQKTRDFMVKYMKADEGAWVEYVHRDGRIKQGVGDDVYGWLFAANGLAEFYKAAGNDRDLEMACESIWAAMRAYDDPNYAGVSLEESPSERVPMRGLRAQGHSMVMVRMLTQLLSHHPDPQLEGLLAQHVDLIMLKFRNPSQGITNERLLHDYSRIPGHEDHMFTGHSVETMWMVMFEAIRQGNDALFVEAKKAFRRYLELCWDYVFEGFGDGDFYVYDGPGRTREALYGVKTMWSHCELMLGLMHILEYTGERWAKQWYGRVRAYAIEAFDTDCGVWRQAVDRLGKDITRNGQSAQRKGNFHQPRYMMLNLLSLDRMIANKGRPTPFPGR
jgi:mannose/cellobiose epimerase-like protein (N-acyl-D-glucosamine 2-epimerase family)